MSDLSSPTPDAVPAAKPAGRGFQLADSAVKRLRTLTEQSGKPTSGLRLSIKGGGCSGLSYVMDWVEAPKEKDKVFARDGGQVYIDPKSFLYLMGAELSFEESFMQSGFKLSNPQAKSSCGCGESFTI
jgi:iron-sulfur cluster assembly protein